MDLSKHLRDVPDFPKPGTTLRYIVPFPPGGLTDVMARLVGQQLGSRWSLNVVIDNKPGGGGQIGAGDCVIAAVQLTGRGQRHVVGKGLKFGLSCRHAPHVKHHGNHAQHHSKGQGDKNQNAPVFVAMKCVCGLHGFAHFLNAIS